MARNRPSPHVASSFFSSSRRHVATKHPSRGYSPVARAGVTPFMVSAQSGDVATVKYFLDHGGDLVKADDKGRTVLHHAVGIEFLLSKGVPIDIDCGHGTPLFWAANNEQDKTVKILLEHQMYMASA
ncbi:unnamed protein product [Triticum turgidum subsp. durum]|uniref:Uncharacterized protein n=1 Tax=Triticum turgidum subsp. durum TaxID=4567 RepID=A0A9R1QDT4_TRITD|nr:unnamed protein product [Triticum turgidum subsp. durum]